MRYLINTCDPVDFYSNIQMLKHNLFSRGVSCFDDQRSIYDASLRSAFLDKFAARQEITRDDDLFIIILPYHDMCRSCGIAARLRALFDSLQVQFPELSMLQLKVGFRTYHSNNFLADYNLNFPDKFHDICRTHGCSEFKVSGEGG